MGYLTITSKDRWFLEHLSYTFGGAVYSQGKGMKGTPMWSLRFSPEEMREILPKIIPSLILKKQEAQLLLQALEITKLHRTKNYDPSTLGAIADKMKELKWDRRLVA